MFQLEGRNTGAAHALDAKQRSRGVPPHWNLYICVESADDAANRASRLCGKVLAPACDVFDAGRMANLQDPTGAIFSVWQPKKPIRPAITGAAPTPSYPDPRH